MWRVAVLVEMCLSSLSSTDQVLAGFGIVDLNTSLRVQRSVIMLFFLPVAITCRPVRFVVYEFVFADGDPALQDSAPVACYVLPIARIDVTVGAVVKIKFCKNTFLYPLS